MDTHLVLADWAGLTIHVTIERPRGSRHPRHADLTYPLDYGFVPDTLAGDGEPVDVYLLDWPDILKAGAVVEARVVAVVHRRNDVEDKLVAVHPGDATPRTVRAIGGAVAFQEQWFDSWVELTDTQLAGR